MQLLVLAVQKLAHSKQDFAILVAVGKQRKLPETLIFFRF